MTINASECKGNQRGLLKDKLQRNYINIKFFFFFAIIKGCIAMREFMLNNLKSGLVVLGLFLMVGVATLTFSFTNNKGNITKNKMVDPVTYYYKLGIQTGWDTDDNWQDTPIEGVSCSNGTVPCRITFDADIYTLQQYLDTFPNVTNLNAQLSTQKKPSTF